MWWMMSENGGHYCSKKTDDICGDVCGQVFSLLSWVLIIFSICFQLFIRTELDLFVRIFILWFRSFVLLSQ